MTPSNDFGLCEPKSDYRRKPCRNVPTADDDMTRFTACLWRAFPGAWSENRLADDAARFLSKEGRRVDPKTVRNWLRGETTPHYRYVTRVLAKLEDDEVLAVIRGRLN